MCHRTWPIFPSNHFSSQAKITQLGISSAVDQNVAGFYVSIDNGSTALHVLSGQTSFKPRSPLKTPLG